MALHPPSNRPPPLTIETTGPGSGADRQPKTPGSKIGAFFGWKPASSPGGESTSTEISDAGRLPLSPMPSTSTIPSNPASAKPALPPPVDVGKANGWFPADRKPSLASLGAGASASASEPGHGHGQAARMAELENELREISSELAGSIRREMELEDLMDRYQTEMPLDANRRTSDYFSDSGTGSVKNAAGDPGERAEDIERVKRGAEQERAQLRVELSQRWQEERSHRTAYESHVQLLENQVQQVCPPGLSQHVCVLMG